MVRARTAPSLLALVMGFALISAPSAGANTSTTAQPLSDEVETCSEENDAAIMSLANASDSSDMSETALAAIEDGELTLQASEDALDIEGVKVHTIESDESDDVYTSVVFPVGGEYSLTSNFTVIFDEDGEIAEFSETLVSENSQGNFNVSSYSNGDLQSSEDTNISFMTDEELQNEEPTTVQTASTGGTIACVSAVLGVGGGTAALIASLCTGACATAATGFSAPVCVACIGGYATVGGASVTAVASCF